MFLGKLYWSPLFQSNLPFKIPVGKEINKYARKVRNIDTRKVLQSIKITIPWTFNKFL